MGLKNQIIELRKKNLTYNKIADKLGCAKSTISYHCKMAGLDDIGLKLESLDPEVVHQIQKFLNENTVVATAKKFGVSESTVKKYKKQIARG
ncbi:MAG: helix-turn-helix domain-containing protein [Richelia sp. RM2_1_2]|nr:helix-turn-helix domain-containing protein [Richelia sp. RM2_1_2]